MRLQQLMVFNKINRVVDLPYSLSPPPLPQQQQALSAIFHLHLTDQW